MRALLCMPQSQPASTPAPKPGDFIFVGRFRNRPAIVTKVFTDQKGTVKYEFEPIPKGRKKSKVRNLLPFRAMTKEEAAKYKKIYDEETAKMRAKKQAGEVLALKVVARHHTALVMPPRRIVDFIKNFAREVAKLKTEWSQKQSELEATRRKLDRQYTGNQMGEFNEKLGLSVPIFASRYDGFSFERLLADLDFQAYLFEGREKERLQLTHISQPRMEDGAVRLIAKELNGLIKSGSPFEKAIHSIAPNTMDRVVASDESFAWNEKYEEGVPPEWITALEEVHYFLKNARTMFQDVARKLDAFGSGDVKPDPTETLYHASVKARQIMSGGFAKEMPKDQLGLGGSQTGKNGTAISFTYDLKAALEIARSFKEAALIATGQVRASEILNWGIRETDLKQFLNMLNAKVEMAHGRKLSLEGAEIDKMNGRWVVKVTDFNRELGDYETIERDVDEVFTDPKDVFNMYDAYLWSHPTRLNPVHFNRYRLVEYLKTADPRDIGVVAAECDMTHPDISSHPGEKEFRVPPAAVIKVTKLYQ